MRQREMAHSPPAFCGAFTPSSQTRFGVFSGVPNGTPFRPNWKIISIPDQSGKKTRGGSLRTSRKNMLIQYLMDTHPKGGGSSDGMKMLPGVECLAPALIMQGALELLNTFAVER